MLHTQKISAQNFEDKLDNETKTNERMNERTYGQTKIRGVIEITRYAEI